MPHSNGYLMMPPLTPEQLIKDARKPFASKFNPATSSSITGGKWKPMLLVSVRCKINCAVNTLDYSRRLHVFVALPHDANIPTNRWSGPSATWMTQSKPCWLSIMASRPEPANRGGPEPKTRWSAWSNL